MRSKMAAPENEKRGRADGCAYAEPLGLTAHLSTARIKIEMVPVLDLIVLALLFSLLFTRFVMVPGVRVDLPESGMRVEASDLPVTVLTIGNRGMLFFDGAVFELDSIERGFKKRIGEMPGQDVVLLVKTEGSMDLQLFLRLCQMAEDAGFVQVQIAGQHALESKGVVPEAGSKGATESSANGVLSIM